MSGVSSSMDASLAAVPSLDAPLVAVDPSEDVPVAPPVVAAAPAPLAAVAPVGFVSLYRERHAEMVRVATLLVGSPEIAQDLVQDCFVRLHRHWSTVREPVSYLRRSVVNACRSHHRRAQRERAHAGERPDPTARPSSPPTSWPTRSPGSPTASGPRWSCASTRTAPRTTSPRSSAAARGRSAR